MFIYSWLKFDYWQKNSKKLYKKNHFTTCSYYYRFLGVASEHLLFCVSWSYQTVESLPTWNGSLEPGTKLQPHKEQLRLKAGTWNKNMQTENTLELRDSFFVGKRCLLVEHVSPHRKLCWTTLARFSMQRRRVRYLHLGGRMTPPHAVDSQAKATKQSKRQDRDEDSTKDSWRRVRKASRYTRHSDAAVSSKVSVSTAKLMCDLKP